MKTLAGKTALVTGGSRGIGRSAAERLAAQGARVGVHYGRNEQAALEVVESIHQAGGSAFALRTELGVPGDAEALWSAFDEHAEGVDILVNNAGISVRPGNLDGVDPETFDRLFSVNTKAAFYIVKHGLSRLRDGGRIINVTSASTRLAHPSAVVYSMSKAAVDVFTRSLAWGELASRGITANVVAPGFIETDMTSWLSAPGVMQWASTLNAAGRVGRPQDVAGVIAFLASDDAQWVNGQSIDASGGMLLGVPPIR